MSKVAIAWSYWVLAVLTCIVMLGYFEYGKTGAGAIQGCVSMFCSFRAVLIDC